MLRIFEYYGRYEGVKQGWGRLPGWARAIVAVFALPGLILMALSILILLVSILALLLLAAPVYRLLAAAMGESRPQTMAAPEEMASPPTGRRHVDVTIIE